MLIGIDLIGIGSPRGGDRESGRLGRQLVSALIDRDRANRYVLYTADGSTNHSLPTARNVLRVVIDGEPAGSSTPRATIRRVLDRNPDGLDWLLLLDPLSIDDGRSLPIAPPEGLRVASMITDLAPSRVDDRRLASLRGHDAILTFSEATASVCRQRLGSMSPSVTCLGLPGGEPSVESASFDDSDGLDRLGITGPFLLANVAGGADRSNLSGILDAYCRLPVEHRGRHQLVIAGVLDRPWAAVVRLQEHRCADGLVLVGDVDGPTLRDLYRRCAAFVCPSIDEGSGLVIVEALRSGAPIVAGRAGSQPGIVGDAGLLADPFDPVEIADRVASLLADADRAHDLRERALARSSSFSWDPVVRTILEVLDEDNVVATGARFRFDRAEIGRPAVATGSRVALEPSAC